MRLVGMARRYPPAAGLARSTYAEGFRIGSRARRGCAGDFSQTSMNKPRIFLGSSGKQAKLLQAITRGLEDVADVEPWTTTFNPGRSTLDRLVELSQKDDLAAFVFPQGDWRATDAFQAGQGAPPQNLGFEAGVEGRTPGNQR